MKRTLIVFIIVILIISLFAPAVSATWIGTLSYSVSTTRVIMTKDGKGSFNITLPAPGISYAGVQFIVQLPDTVKIAVSYSLANGATIMLPQTSPDDKIKDNYYFGFFADNNSFTSQQTCTISVSYNGPDEASLTIKEVKQYSMNGHELGDLVSNITTAVTLVPYSEGGGDPTDPGVDPDPGGDPTDPGVDPDPGDDPKIPGGSDPSDTGSSQNKSSTSALAAYDVTDSETPLDTVFPFTDVKDGDWFYDNVLYMWKNNLMNGISETLFDPQGLVTRGMVVTVLYRMEDEPDTTSLNNPFEDVSAGLYYTDAVTWAAENEIVRGYGDGKFGPTDNVTREQLATILMFGVLLVIMMLYFLFSRLTREYEEKHGYLLQNKMLEMQSSHLDEITETYNNLRNMRHELRNHFMCMDALIQNNQYKQLHEYFNTLFHSNLLISDMIESGNNVVNAILNQKKSYAFSKGIHMHAQAFLPEQIGVKDYDMCAVVSNLLDNAIEACEEIDNPSVWVDLSILKNYVSITVRNPVTEDVIKENPQLDTTKDNKQNHGLGIKIIRSIIDQYDGMLSFEMRDGLFVASAMMKLT